MNLAVLHGSDTRKTAKGKQLPMVIVAFLCSFFVKHKTYLY